MATININDYRASKGISRNYSILEMSNEQNSVEFVTEVVGAYTDSNEMIKIVIEYLQAKKMEGYNVSTKSTKLFTPRNYKIFLAKFDLINSSGKRIHSFFRIYANDNDEGMMIEDTISGLRV
jgi:hypothetical protein